MTLSYHNSTNKNNYFTLVIIIITIKLNQINIIKNGVKLIEKHIKSKIKIFSLCLIKTDKLINIRI